MTQEKLISFLLKFQYHMTHIDNLDTIFKYGMYPHNNIYQKKDISNQDVNSRRDKVETIYNRNLHDYVPFYFNPRNAMMYKNKNEDIIVIEFKGLLNNIKQGNILFTKKNAAANCVCFFNNLKHLYDKDFISKLYNKTWYNDNTQKQIMMAEVLVYKHVNQKNISRLFCKDQATKDRLIKRYGIKNQHIVVRPSVFFK